MPIDVLPGAEDDIAELEATDPEALATVMAFLEEADGDTELERNLTTEGNVEFGSFRLNIRRWQSAQSSGNLLRVRILETPATSYRVVYGYDWRKRRVGILAIVHKKKFDYELDAELSRRILDDWDTATDGQPT